MATRQFEVEIRTIRMTEANTPALHLKGWEARVYKY